MLNRFLPALRVHTIMLPLLRSKRLQQREICLAQRAELLQRFARVALVVVAARDPGVLIEGNNRRARRAQNEAHAKAAHDFRIGEMRENLADRPLISSRTLTQSAR